MKLLRSLLLSIMAIIFVGLLNPIMINAEGIGSISGYVLHMPNNIARLYINGKGISPITNSMYALHGAEVSLYDAEMNFLNKMVTTDGSYNFKNLDDGTYYVKLTNLDAKHMFVLKAANTVIIPNAISSPIVVSDGKAVSNNNWFLVNNNYAFRLSTSIGFFEKTNSKNYEIFPSGYGYNEKFNSFFGILHGDSPSQYEGYNDLDIPVLLDSEKEFGYEFIGWRQKGIDKILTTQQVLSTIFYEDNEFEAVFTYPKHTVTFATNLTRGSFDGEERKFYTFAGNTSKVTEIPTPEAKEGYKFVGWFEDLTINPITEDKIKDIVIKKDYTYYAKYEKVITYKVYYDGGSNGVVTANNKLTKNVNENIETVGTIKQDQGYEFTGKWKVFYYDGNSSDIYVGKEFTSDEIKNIKTDGNISFMAMYTSTSETNTKYTVTYLDGVNNELFESQVYKDIEKNEKTPEFTGKLEREGYKFVGWTPIVYEKVTKDAIYIAQWEKIEDGTSVTDTPKDQNEESTADNNKTNTDIKVPITALDDYKELIIVGSILALVGIGIFIYAIKKDKNKK